MILWSASDAAKATGGTVKGDWSSVSGISIDTRTLQPGDLFVALKAERDGHDFAATALENGASAAMVSYIPKGLRDADNLLLVDDVLGGLEALGRAARVRTNARVVAITGSVGKTSTKEMLRSICADQGRCHASVASYNNHWGVPLTLARMPQDTDFVVIEIGMNHPGEISPLAQMARPHVALITTVAAAHLEAFDDIAGIAKEKAAILDGVEPGGTAVLNADLETSPILFEKAEKRGCKSVGFGETTSDYVLSDVQLHDTTTVVQAQFQGASVLYKIAAPGRHFAMNGLGALAAADALGADRALALQILGRWSPYEGRGAREVIALDTADPDLTLQLIDESYNANPTSMAAALEVLSVAKVTHNVGRVSKGRRIAIVGDMKELGTQAPELHAELADLPFLDQIDTIHCVGPLMQHLHGALAEDKKGLWCDTSDALAARISGLLDCGDVVMAKGSLSMKLARVVDAIRKMGHGANTDSNTT